MKNKTEQMLDTEYLILDTGFGILDENGLEL
jgi:hypothetical protein